MRYKRFKPNLAVRYLDLDCLLIKEFVLSYAKKMTF